MGPSTLWPLVATLVCGLYAVGVVVRHSTLWYEWVGAFAGLGAALWFWYTESRRAKRRREKGERP